MANGYANIRRTANNEGIDDGEYAACSKRGESSVSISLKTVWYPSNANGYHNNIREFRASPPRTHFLIQMRIK
jgi:hypothetical protein